MTKALFNEQHQTASLKPITMLQFLILITFSFKSTLQTEIILLAKGAPEAYLFFTS